jgi:hypothetical protein
VAQEREVEKAAVARPVRSLLDSSSEDEAENELDSDVQAYLRKVAGPDARNDSLAKRVLAEFSKRTRLAAFHAAKAEAVKQSAPKTPQPLTVIKKLHIQIETEDAYELVEQNVEVPLTPHQQALTPRARTPAAMKRWQKAKLGVHKGVAQAKSEEAFYFKQHVTGRAFVPLLANTNPDVVPEPDKYGWAEYLRRCRRSGIVPCSSIFEQLRTGMLLLRSSSLGNAGLCALFPVLEHCRFAVLDLRDNNLVEDEALRELSWQIIGGSAPSDMPRHLRQLSLSHNPLGIGGCAIVADMLQQLQSLEYLLLDSVRMHDKGAEKLMSALAQHNGIVHVSVRDNKLTKASGMPIARLVHANVRYGPIRPHGRSRCGRP